jgi:hypothetical protein
MAANQHYYCQGHRATDTNRKISVVDIEQYKEENRREQQEGTDRPPNYVIKYDQIESIRAKIKDELTARRNNPLYKDLSVVDNTNVHPGDIVKGSPDTIDPKALGAVIRNLASAINNIKITNPLKTTNTITGDYEPGKSNVTATGYSTDKHYSDIRPHTYDGGTVKTEDNPVAGEWNHIINASDMGDVANSGDPSRPNVQKNVNSMSGRTQYLVQGCICHSDCFDFWFENVPDPCAHCIGYWYDCGCDYG